MEGGVQNFSSMKEPANHSRKHTRRVAGGFSCEANRTTRAAENSLGKLRGCFPKSDHQSQAQNLCSRQDVNDPVEEKETVVHKDMGRERLKRHREEVAGTVVIPDIWGQESLLKDWIDYSSFDKLLAPNGITSAREALVAERRRVSSQRLRIESRC